MTHRTSVSEVLAFLGVDDPEVPRSLRAEGLFEAEELSADECEELRVAVHLMCDLGVNAAACAEQGHLVNSRGLGSP